MPAAKKNPAIYGRYSTAQNALRAMVDGSAKIAPTPDDLANLRALAIVEAIQALTLELETLVHVQSNRP